ncbi:MAG: hypothetical protein CVU47_00880, partial [Chloroflexi bacterium HGW-Chloroflexi-9]
GRRPRRSQLAALALSSAGCVLTLWTRGSYPLVGYAFGLAVAVSYAGYLVAGERSRRRALVIWIGLLVAGVAVGLAAWAYQLANGLAATNMRNPMMWGLYITMFMYFVGLSAGGLIVAYGTPEEVARNESSVTGRFLQEVLDRHAPVAPPPAKPKRTAKPSNGATPEASPKQVKAAKAAARQTRAAAGRK